MSQIELIIGGARSGKSRYAANCALQLAASPVYVATSRIWDADHRRRIERHREDRSDVWVTVEEESNLSKAGQHGDVLVVDCVTLWLTNLFHDSGFDAEVALELAQKEFDKAVAAHGKHWFFVSNEVGQGVHPETESGRKFADLSGLMNQYIARAADSVTLMVAGLPLPVKGQTGALVNTGHSG